MSDIAIRVQDVSKLYRIGQRRPHDTLRDLLAGAISVPFRRRGPLVPGRPSDHVLPRSSGDDQLWALQDVSLQMRHGEVLGIIGSNGAGKSTLLKILSRITEPTSGYAEVHGRLGSLLEVGTGFKADLTGRENIYLNGAILGMKRSEIRHRFDEIVEFSEIARFIDTPVKYYSSGMYMRLAFSVAAHLEPDILIVDEVLSVGDVSFQNKCLSKMGHVAQSGRAVLFVSHNMLAVEDLCNRAIWLKDGSIADDGQPSAVISNYLQVSLSAATERVWKDQSTAPGNDEVRLHRACVRPVNGSSADPITVRTPFVMEFEYRSLRSNTYLALAVELYNEQGIVIFSSSPPFDPAGHDLRGLYRHICQVPGDLLNDGIHRVILHIADSDDRIILKQNDILVFDVQDSTEMRDGWYGKWTGAIRPMLDWSTELVGAEP